MKYKELWTRLYYDFDFVYLTGGGQISPNGKFACMVIVYRSIKDSQRRLPERILN